MATQPSTTRRALFAAAPALVLLGASSSKAVTPPEASIGHEWQDELFVWPGDEDQIIAISTLAVQRGLRPDDCYMIGRIFRRPARDRLDWYFGDPSKDAEVTVINEAGAFTLTLGAA